MLGQLEYMERTERERKIYKKRKKKKHENISVEKITAMTQGCECLFEKWTDDSQTICVR